MNQSKLNSKYNWSKVLLVISILLLLLTFVLDWHNYVSQLFALVFIGIIYKYFNYSPRKTYYYITFLFCILNYTLTIPLEKIIGINQDLHVYYIYLLGYIVYLFINTVKNKNYSISMFKNPINILTCLFGMYVFGSFFIAKDKSLAINRLIIYSIMFSFVTMIVVENSEKKLMKNTLKFLMYLSIGILFLGTFKIITGIQIEPYSNYVPRFGSLHNMQMPYNRIPTIFFYNPNDYAMVVTLILLGFVIKFIYDNNNKQRIFSITIIILAQINIFFSRSRTGWIGCIVSLIFLVVYLLIRLRLKESLKALICAVCVIFIFNITLKVPQLINYTGKMTEIVKQNNSNNKDAEDKKNREKDQKDEGGIQIGNYGSINVRSTLIVNSIESVFKEKNYFGVGVGNSTRYMMNKGNTYGTYDVHNWWFEVLLEYGVVGFGIFLLLYSSLCLKFIFSYTKNKDNNEFLKILMLIFLVGNSLLIFGPSSVVAFTPFWTIMALALASINII